MSCFGKKSWRPCGVVVVWKEERRAWEGGQVFGVKFCRLESAWGMKAANGNQPGKKKKPGTPIGLVPTSLHQKESGKLSGRWSTGRWDVVESVVGAGTDVLCREDLSGKARSLAGIKHSLQSVSSRPGSLGGNSDHYVETMEGPLAVLYLLTCLCSSMKVQPGYSEVLSLVYTSRIGRARGFWAGRGSIRWSSSRESSNGFVPVEYIDMIDLGSNPSWGKLT